MKEFRLIVCIAVHQKSTFVALCNVIQNWFGIKISETISYQISENFYFIFNDNHSWSANVLAGMIYVILVI